MNYNEKINLAIFTSDIRIQEILSEDSDWRIRYYLVGNSNLNIKIQNILSKDSYTGVRINLVHNPDIDCNILINLIFDLNKDMQNYARAKLYKNFDKCSSEIKTYIINNLDLFKK